MSRFKFLSLITLVINYQSKPFVLMIGVVRQNSLQVTIDLEMIHLDLECSDE